MKTAVIFCNQVSERKLSRFIQKFYQLNQKFDFFNYPRGFCKGMTKVEIVENFGDIDDQPYKWCVDIVSSEENKNKFKAEVDLLNQHLASKCKTAIDWNKNVNLD